MSLDGPSPKIVAQAYQKAAQHIEPQTRQGVWPSGVAPKDHWAHYSKTMEKVKRSAELSATRHVELVNDQRELTGCGAHASELDLFHGLEEGICMRVARAWVLQVALQTYTHLLK